jgi:small-conductance mechanosensitive channel
MKRGPKSAHELRGEIKKVMKERDDYRAQLRRRETDFENRTRALHSAKVQTLTSKLETDGDLARRAREAAVRSAAESAKRADEVDQLTAQLARERIRFEAELHDADVAAKNRLSVAVATKVRMIASRDAKLADAKEAADEIQRELDAQVELHTERLATIRRLCGKVGGRPRVPRTEEELEASELDINLTLARNNMASVVANAIGQVGEDDEISTVALMQALQECGYLEKVFESQLMWDLRMEWVDGLSDDLSLAWTAQLSSDLRDRLLVSYDN